jgi:uncharacterized protein
MAVDYIRYDILAQEALRGLVRTVLADTAAKGLPGDHHFFITFETGAEGVRLSPRLRSQHPINMTIVLQHQFWDLSVSEEAFEVGLSFNGIPEKLRIPWGAITDFVDPSVEFGLKFAVVGEADKATDEQAPVTPATATGATLGETPRPPARHEARPVASAGQDQGPAQAPAQAPAQPPAPAPAGLEPPVSPNKPDGGAEVVRLDRFRKK